MFHFPHLTITLALGLSCAAFASASAETVQVGGTGMGLGFMQAAGKRFEATRPGTTVEVLPSLGSSGGVKALAAKAIDVAIIASLPTTEQTALGLKAGVCFKTALVLATSRPDSPAITRAQLPTIFADPNAAWPDGEPLKIILRGRAGSENAYLIRAVPGMESALDAAYKRGGIPIGSTDQENVELANRTAGSLAVTTLLQIRAEQLSLRPLPLDGTTASVQTLATGAYPFPLDLCLLVRDDSAAAAKALIAFMRSPEGEKVARGFDALPIE